MKRIIAFLVSVWMLLGVGMGLAEPVQMAAPELLEPVGVKLDTAPVTRQAIYNLFFYDGSIVPYVEELCFEIDGVVESVIELHNDSLCVKKGDVLAVLDQSDLQDQADALRRSIEYQQRMIDFQKVEDELSLREAALRVSTREASGQATQGELQIMRADIAILSEQMKQARQNAEFALEVEQKKLEEIEGKLGNNVIVAPFDGRIVYTAGIRKNSGVQAHQPIFYLADDTRLMIDASYISQSQIASANRIYAQIGATIYDVTPQEIDWQEFVALMLAGGELRTKFYIDEPDENVSSGKYVAVFLMSSLVEDALAIPVNALYVDSAGRYVYKIEGDTRVRCPVSLGRTTNTFVQVLEGLEEGDYVYVKE